MILGYISQLLGDHGIIQREDIDTCRYGLEVFTTSVLEMLSVLIISLFFRNFISTVLFFIAFVPLRIYAGGYHADTKLRCYLILLAVYMVFTLLIRYTPTNYNILLEITSVVSAWIMVLAFAPIVNDKKSINETENAFYRKVCIIIMLVESSIILIGILIFPINNYMLSFSLGQLAVSSSMIAAFVKRKLMGGEKNEKGSDIF